MLFDESFAAVKSYQSRTNSLLLIWGAEQDTEVGSVHPAARSITGRQYPTLLRRVNRWREDARGRGVIIVAMKYRRDTGKPRGRRPTPSAP